MTLSQHAAILPIIIPLLTAPVVSLSRGGALAWAGAVLASLCAFAVSVSLVLPALNAAVLGYDVGNWPAPFGIALHVDALSVLMLLVITGASLLALVFGKASLDVQIGEARAPLFYCAWLLVTGGLCGMAATGDAFNIFVFMEISSLATYILIANGPDRRALMATFRYLSLGTIGATFYLIGVGLIYMMTGTLNIADMAARLADVSDTRPVLVAAGFITVGLGLKAAMFPLHAWMPNAYCYAPHAATVFLAACSTKVAVYVLIRMNMVVLSPNLEEHSVNFSALLMVVSVMAFLIGSTLAIYENNLKRLLGYSSVAQIGYILLGVSLASTAGLTGGIVHLFNHALIKAGLFMAVAAMALRFGSVRLDDINGIGRAMPWTVGAFVALGLSLIGVPSTAGFISKWYLLLAALERGNIGYLLVALILISSVLAVIYIGKVVERAYFRAPEETEQPRSEAPLPMLVLLWGIVAANFYFGIQPQLPLGLAGEAASGLITVAP